MNTFQKILREKFLLLIIIAIAVQIIFSSCEEVIEININDIQQNLVVDGAITDKPGTSKVLIGMSESVFKSESNIKISGAIVSIRDQEGNSDNLVESEKGKYTLHSLKPEIGKTYTLTVVHNGKEYHGVSTLNAPMIIDSVKFNRVYEYSTWGISFYKYKIRIYIANKPDVDEYCLIKLKDAGGKYRGAVIVYQDKFANNNQIILEETISEFQKGEKIIIELFSIDKNSYDYFYQLNELSANSGVELPDILNYKDYNPKSNLSGGALGCFYTYSLSSLSTTVK